MTHSPHVLRRKMDLTSRTAVGASDWSWRSVQCMHQDASFPYENANSVINRTSREVLKIKPRRTATSVEPSTRRGVRRPLFAQDDDEVFVTGSTLYAGGQTPRTQPPWS